MFNFIKMSWGSSGNIVFNYGLDDLGSVPGRGKNFSSSLCIQTGFRAHKTSYPVIAGVMHGWGMIMTIYLDPV
jgi:hypothetical protein